MRPECLRRALRLKLKSLVAEIFLPVVALPARIEEEVRRTL